jgi:hypothetical protein
VNLQNLDSEGSGDFVITADDGNDASNYLAVGLAGSSHINPNFPSTLPHEGYVYVIGGNLDLQSGDGNVEIISGNISRGQITVTQSNVVYLGENVKIRFPDGTLQNTAFGGNANLTSINANITAANVNIAVLFANAAAQSLELDNQRANAASQGAALSILTANASSQAISINLISSNINAINANTSALTTSINTTNANVTAANIKINTLLSNAASQALDIDNLYSNAATQQGSIVSLQANAATQQGSIVSLQANAATQSVQITLLNANLSAANAIISSLTSNSAVQGNQLNILNANAAAQALQLDNLQTNVNSWSANTYANANVAIYLLNNTANVANLITTGGVYWANGAPYSSGGGADNVLRANVGAYQIYANANAATQTTAINLPPPVAVKDEINPHSAHKPTP